MPYALREALAAFQRSPVLTGLSAAMIGLSLFVVGLFGLAAHNIRRVLDDIESRVEVVAYLRDDASTAAVELALGDIRAFPEVLEVIHISRGRALEIARQQLPELRSLFTGLEVNPLPASFEIRLRPGSRSPAAVDAVAARLADYGFIEDISYGRDWIGKVHLLRQIAGAAAFVVGGAFAAVAMLIIGAAVRMAIFARKDEIAIMRLVGATDAFVRRPFLLEGLLAGMLGAGFALAMTFGVYKVFYNAVFRLDWMPDAWVAAGLAAGGILGVLASAGAVRHHLREL